MDVDSSKEIGRLRPQTTIRPAPGPDGGPGSRIAERGALSARRVTVKTVTAQRAAAGGRSEEAAEVGVGIAPRGAKLVGDHGVLIVAIGAGRGIGADQGGPDAIATVLGDVKLERGHSAEGLAHVAGSAGVVRARDIPGAPMLRDGRRGIARRGAAPPLAARDRAPLARVVAALGIARRRLRAVVAVRKVVLGDRGTASLHSAVPGAAHRGPDGQLHRRTLAELGAALHELLER